VSRHRRRQPVRIGPVRLVREDGLQRLEADVEGERVWFETRDTALHPAPEAFASAFLLPALHAGVGLEVAEPLPVEWHGQLPGLMRIYRRWWGYPVIAPRAPGPMPAPAELATGRGPGVALFFSGGVDSFYSLLRTDAGPDRLVAVQGFDVALDDGVRMAAVEATLRAVSAARGLKAIVVRTNLRTHPLIASLPWERAHGGALAAVAHALGDGVGEVIVSSSVAYHWKHHWGSHWSTDHLFSSGRVRLRQVGMDQRRPDKVRQIAGEPLVQRHLSVCWENTHPTGNCSRCHKCLITRLLLADAGVLDDVPGFEGTATLVAHIDAVTYDRGHLNTMTDLARSTRLEPGLKRALEALLRRSLHSKRLHVRARRAIVGRVLGWTRGRRS